MAREKLVVPSGLRALMGPVPNYLYTITTGNGRKKERKKERGREQATVEREKERKETSDEQTRHCRMPPLTFVKDTPLDCPYRRVLRKVQHGFSVCPVSHQVPDGQITWSDLCLPDVAVEALPTLETTSRPGAVVATIRTLSPDVSPTFQDVDLSSMRHTP